MTQPSPTHIVLANGARGPNGAHNPIRLEYRPRMAENNVHLDLPSFVRHVHHLPTRVLDMLEIAAYVFAADRRLFRGDRTAVTYEAWSRNIEFHIKVRDYRFWRRREVREALCSALDFMTGDAKYTFMFEPGHSTPPAGLFDRKGHVPPYGQGPVRVALFSGGVDSLCGALELLQDNTAQVVLVSHESQSGTVHTQQALVNALSENHPGRIFHYRFGCTLQGFRAREETQRTRSFLYTSIAYAIASAYGEHSFCVHENGVTSINLRRREDLANARASRTTHPKTIARLAQLFSLVAGSQVTIRLPYLQQTKADIIQKLVAMGPGLLSSAVSCTRTFKLTAPASQCGLCFQCVDRRIASYASNAEQYDHRGLYSKDIITEPVDDGEARTTLVDYIRQAFFFANGTISRFEDEYFADLSDIIDHVDLEGTEAEKIESLWNLFHRHGEQVRISISRMRHLHEDVSKPIARGSILDVVSRREYLEPEQERFAASITEVIRPAVGDMFARNKPKDEADLNEKIGALLRTHYARLRSEHPTISFACARVVPDHSWPEHNVLVEAKFIRDNTMPSKATEGIAADLTKYPRNAFIVFVVYDPTHRILSDAVFQGDIESKGRTRVVIIR